MRVLLAAVMLVAFNAYAAQAEEKISLKKEGLDAERSAIIAQEGWLPEDEIRLAPADLNSDGHPEILAYNEGSMWCGSAGCSLVVYRQINGAWQKLLGVTTYDDMAISDSVTNGYRDVVLHDGNGNPLVWKFNGTGYSR